MTTHHPHETIRCGAALWKRGNRCKNEAAPGSIYCPAHLSLLAPLEWVTGGYARVIDDGSRPLFRSAAFATLSEEVALARYELSALIRDAAAPMDVISGIRTVANLVKLQRKIEDAVFRRTPAARGRALPR